MENNITRKELEQIDGVDTLFNFGKYKGKNMIKTKIYRTVHMKDDKIMYGDYHFDRKLVELHARALSNLSDYYPYIKDIRIEEADLISYSDDEEVELTPAEQELNHIKICLGLENYDS